jgi:hypothetical protein
MRAIKIVRRYGNEREEGFRVIEGTIFAVDKPLSIGGKELRVIKASRAKTLVESRLAREWDPGEKAFADGLDEKRYPTTAHYQGLGPTKKRVEKPQTQKRATAKRRPAEKPADPRPLTLANGGRTGEASAPSSSAAAQASSSSTSQKPTRGTRRPAGSRLTIPGGSQDGQPSSTPATGPGGASNQGRRGSRG